MRETTGVIRCCAIKSVAAWRSALEPIVEPKDQTKQAGTAAGKRGGLTYELLIPQHLPHCQGRLRRDRHPVEHDPPTGAKQPTDLLGNRPPS